MELPKVPRWLRRVAALLLAVIVLSPLAAALLPADFDVPGRWCDLGESRAACLRSWIGNYAGWAAAIVAGIAAYFAWSTVLALVADMEKREDLEEKRRQREQYAARAVLPLALDLLWDYARDCADALKLVLDKTTETRVVPTGHLRKPPRLPDKAIPALREAIRFSEPQEAKQIADLIAQLQVQNANIDGLGDKRQTVEHDVHSVALQTVILHNLIAGLYPFGRRKEEGDWRAQVDGTQVRSSLRLLGFHRAKYPRLHELVDRRWPASKDADY